MTLGKLPWRTGRRIGRTLYDANDQLVGVLDTPELAERVVTAVNRAHVAEQYGKQGWELVEEE